MESDGRNKAGRRLIAFGGAVLLWSGLILLQLFRLQVIRHGEYVRAAHRQQEESVELTAPRGSMYDRTGELLAGSVKRDSVYIDPLQVPDLQLASGILAGILHLDRGTLYNRMQWYVANQRGFMWVAKAIDPDQCDRLRSLHLDWIRFEKESWRNYPRNMVAAHVIGAVDKEEVGQWGLEKSEEQVLSGAAGSLRALAGRRGRPGDPEAPAGPGGMGRVPRDSRRLAG